MSSSPECRSCGIYIHSGPVICEDCISKLLTTARDTAAREMREACAAACDGEPHKMDSEMRGYGREFGERIRALPLPSEKETG